MVGASGERAGAVASHCDLAWVKEQGQWHPEATAEVRMPNQRSQRKRNLNVTV